MTTFEPETDLLEKDLLGAPLHPQYQFLPLDTKHFPDLELESWPCSTTWTPLWTAGWCTARTTRRLIRCCPSFGNGWMSFILTRRIIQTHLKLFTQTTIRIHLG